MAQPLKQPAAAEADEQHVQRPGLLDQLERDRALAGHHALVVVGVDRDQPALLRRARASSSLAVRGVAVEEHDLGAVAAGGGELARGRVLGHQDHGGALVQARGEASGLGVVAAGDRRDAAAGVPRGSRDATAL